MSRSTAERIASSAESIDALLDAITEEQALALLRDWQGFLARPEQLPPPGQWDVWAMIAGRGFGKTRSGAEWVADNARRMPRSRWAVVCPTGDDVVETAFHGESGLLTAVLAEHEIAGYSSLKKRVTLTNGSIIRGFAAIEPERLRGPQFHGAWCDEVAAWYKGGVSYVDAAWDMLAFGVRLPYKMPDGTAWHPRVVTTSTPKPIALIRKWIKAVASGDTSIRISTGSTYDNLSNLAPSAVKRLRERYEGTRLGRQELLAEVLEDVEGALWTLANIESHRVRAAEMPPLVRIVVAVDPAVTATGASSETGIIVAGRDANGHGHVLADLSQRAHPDEWARAVVRAYDDHRADRVVVETNQGGEMVASLLRTVRPTIPITEVQASRGKRTRAEPIAALYEQGKVHHITYGENAPIGGSFDVLETQLTTWTPDDKDSPDRLDALVWAFTDLMEHSSAAAFIAAVAPPCPMCHLPMEPGGHTCPSAKVGNSFLDGLQVKRP